MKTNDDNFIRVSVDIVVFGFHEQKLQILLIKRKFEPFQNDYALPGGFVLPDEDLEFAALRELKEETNFSPSFIEQLYTFGDPGRDPRGQVITVAYMALLPGVPEVKGGTDAMEARWFPVYDLPHLGFDHQKIISYGLERLKNKIEWTSLGFQLLPQRFILSDLQKVFEQILNKKIDKRNFRKKIKLLNILKPLKEWKKENTRPARYYELNTLKVQKLKDKGILFPF